MTDLFTPPPPDFGAPKKFPTWREGQDKLFWDVIDCKLPYSIHNASVGCGKSLAYLTAALASGKRVAFLTESKGLQDQLQKDFGSVGLFDMRGLQNYTCRALDQGGHLETLWKARWGRPTCDIGPCTAGIRCDLKNSGCDYFDDNRRACAANLVSTNYAYWIAIHKYGQGLGKFDWLVLDEAHAAPDALSAALSVEFTQKDFKELKTMPPQQDATPQAWRMWSRVQLGRVQNKLEFFAHGAKIGNTGIDGIAMMVNDTDIPDATELKFWKKLEGKCQMISESGDNDWVIDVNADSGNVRMAPVWVRHQAAPYLFRNIPRVIMMSATVREKTADLLGIPIGKYEFTEYPSTFPVERRPLFWIPTVRLNKDMPQNDMRSWVVRIDQIIAYYARYGLKGIVHTVSYPKQKYILAHSRFKHLMHANTPGTAREVVKSFRDSAGPAVLVSPSVGTGFDFPFDAARFQIIAKLPFRDQRSKVLQVQAKEDPKFLDYLVAQDLLQMYGRINRDPFDAGHSWIIDDHIEWFIKKKELFAQYFLDAFTPVTSICPDMEFLLHDA